jgi:hypothetical protein
MSVNVEAFNRSYATFKQQVIQFNKELETSPLKTKKLKEIYKIVAEETTRLQAYARAAQAREEEFEHHTCFTFTPTTKAIWTITALHTAAKVFEIGGVLLAIIAGEDNSQAKWGGFGVFIATAVCDLVGSGYETFMNLRGAEIVELSQLNKEGVEHAETFKKFLEELIKIRKLGKKLLKEATSQESSSLSNHTVIPLHPSGILDLSIRDCLRLYDTLPNSYRRNDLYCRILSLLIHHLPPSDPLRIGLAEFEPTEDLSILADRSLPIQYFPRARRRNPFHVHEHEEDKWSNEQQSKKEKLHVESIDSEDLRLEFKERLAYFKEEVAQRFQTTRPIAFFETEHGWRVDGEEGVHRISKSTEKSSSHSETLLIPIEEKPKENKEPVIIPNESIV